MTYTLNMKEHRHVYTIATLTDEAGNVQEFKDRTKRLALRKVVAYLGSEKALIYTDEFQVLKASQAREIPRNINVRLEVARR
ncbi:hypothetical protein ACFQWC_14230 [Rossellomorea sp. GCM10028870]|uniref:hypothetical protein n=1 Tax=Rossellomorea sp. GCM10028870 TaxID=3273426 RepID=UPI0036097B70